MSRADGAITGGRTGFRAAASGLGLAVAIVIGMLALWFSNQAAEIAATDWVTHTYEVIRQLERVNEGLVRSESAARGLLLHREPSLLAEARLGLMSAREGAANARALTADNAAQQVRLRALDPLLRARLRQLERSLESPAPDMAEVIPVLPEIRQRLDELVDAEEALLAKRSEARAWRGKQARWTAAIGGALATVLVVAAFALLLRNYRVRMQAETLLQERLSLSDVVQACRNEDEAYQLVDAMAGRILPSSMGYVAVTHASRNMVEVRSRWGIDILSTVVFGPEDCWAMRRGRPHVHTPGDTTLPCKHLHGREPALSICQPLVAHGDLLGILHVSADHDSARLRSGAAVLGDHLGMVLANLRLQESLRHQSIRDPLTGLFNRRYLEETLGREIIRATRAQQSVGLILIDVDHFKRFNDSFGHEAGDLVLQEIGAVLRARTRGSDVAARLGGEELAVLLPAADLAQTSAKAEAIRAAVSALELRHLGRALGQVHVSAGVAASPAHGNDPAELLRLADGALYEAKRAGRNRVARAGVTAARGSTPTALALHELATTTDS